MFSAWAIRQADAHRFSIDSIRCPRLRLVDVPEHRHAPADIRARHHDCSLYEASSAPVPSGFMMNASLKLDDEKSASLTATHCPYCALQCGMNLARQDHHVAVVAREFPTNSGGLCQKGWSAAELLCHPERLT